MYIGTMNTAKKGYLKEKYARDILIERGFKIVFKSVRFKFGCIDYAELFDIVAVRGKEKLHVSNKHFGNSNYHKPHQKEIKAFKKDHGLPTERFELWLWVSPRWVGRGKNKVWQKGNFKVIKLE